MKKCILLIATLTLSLSAGCSSEQKDASPLSMAPPEQIKALSQTDREKIAGFEKELFSIETLSRKAMTIVGNELKQVLKGEQDTVDVTAVVDRAKGEAMQSLDNVITKAVPAKLPPWFAQNLAEAKKGFSDAYKAKIASFEAIKRFADEKNPAALLEFKQQGALADRQFKDARERLAAVLKASGLPQNDSDTPGRNPGK